MASLLDPSRVFCPVFRQEVRVFIIEFLQITLVPHNNKQQPWSLRVPSFPLLSATDPQPRTLKRLAAASCGAPVPPASVPFPPAPCDPAGEPLASASPPPSTSPSDPSEAMSAHVACLCMHYSDGSQIPGERKRCSSRLRAAKSPSVLGWIVSAAGRERERLPTSYRLTWKPGDAFFPQRRRWLPLVLTHLYGGGGALCWCSDVGEGIRKGQNYCITNNNLFLCVYYCRTYYKAVCGGGGGQ